MERTELEKLVHLVVERVIEQIAAKQNLIASSQKSIAVFPSAPKPATQKRENSPVSEKKPKEFCSDKHLLTEQDIILFAREGVEQLIISQSSIITPSAQDRANAKGITIQRGGSRGMVSPKLSLPRMDSRIVAIFLPRITLTEKNAICEVIDQAGYRPFIYSATGRTAASDTNIIQEIAQAVAFGKYAKALIVHENAFPISIQANKIDGVRAAVVWKINSTGLSQKETQANILILNNRLLGLRSMSEIARAWFTSANKNI